VGGREGRGRRGKGREGGGGRGGREILSNHPDTYYVREEASLTKDTDIIKQAS
jgi:hypothetical protein